MLGKKGGMIADSREDLQLINVSSYHHVYGNISQYTTCIPIGIPNIWHVYINDCLV